MEPGDDITSITRVSTPYELSPLSFDAPYEFPRHFLPTVMKGDFGADLQMHRNLTGVKQMTVKYHWF